MARGAGRDNGDLPPGPPAKAALSLVAAALLYGNVAVLLGPVERRFPALPRLPAPALPADFFKIFGVFSTYERVNRELVMEGLAELPDGRREWVRLDLDEHFPAARGEQQTRVWADRSLGPLSRTHRESQQFVMDRVKERENRLRPERRIVTVRVVAEVWPRRTEGWTAGRDPATVQRVTWYEG